MFYVASFSFIIHSKCGENWWWNRAEFLKNWYYQNVYFRCSFPLCQFTCWHENQFSEWNVASTTNNNNNNHIKQLAIDMSERESEEKMKLRRERWRVLNWRKLCSASNNNLNAHYKFPMETIRSIIIDCLLREKWRDEAGMKE